MPEGELTSFTAHMAHIAILWIRHSY